MAQSSKVLDPRLSQSTAIVEPPTRTATPAVDLPCADLSFDEYTLSAYGDISLTNIYFVPGLPSDVSTEKLDPETEKERTPPGPPPVMPQLSKYLVKSRRSIVIQNILPASPAKALITDDFENLVKNLRPCPAHALGKLTTENSSPRISPRPGHAINLRIVEKSREIPKPRMTSAFPPPPPTSRAPMAPRPSPPVAITRPKPKERPLRGYAKLPPRPPIPRWDLLDSGIYGNVLEKHRTS